jgi:ATP-dependent RNA helicase DDX60
MEDVTSRICAGLRSVLLSLGLASIEVSEPPSSKANGRKTDVTGYFKFIKLISKSKGTPLYDFFSIAEDPTVFQLRNFGEYMDRSMGSQIDPRVSFSPDEWQRRVLNAIDRNDSMLVVAPTSAGWVFV